MGYIPGCSCDNGVEPGWPAILCRKLFSPPFKYSYILHSCYPGGLFKKICPFSSRLNEKDLPFLSGYCKYESWKPGPTPKVGENTLPRKNLRKGERVKNMLLDNRFCVMLAHEIEHLRPTLKFIYVQGEGVERLWRKRCL